MSELDLAVLRKAAEHLCSNPRRFTFEMAAEWMVECGPGDVLSLLDRIEELEAFLASTGTI